EALPLGEAEIDRGDLRVVVDDAVGDLGPGPLRTHGERGGQEGRERRDAERRFARRVHQNTCFVRRKKLTADSPPLRLMSSQSNMAYSIWTSVAREARPSGSSVRVAGERGCSKPTKSRRDTYRPATSVVP